MIFGLVDSKMPSDQECLRSTLEWVDWSWWGVKTTEKEGQADAPSSMIDN